MARKSLKQQAPEGGGLAEAGTVWHGAEAGPDHRLAPHDLARLGSLGYTAEEINMLVVPRRTLARRTANGERLSVEETDKAMRLERIAAQAARVFGDAGKANRWLRLPKARLANATPVAYLASEAGARVVEDMLHQIEHGIYA